MPTAGMEESIKARSRLKRSNCQCLRSSAQKLEAIDQLEKLISGTLRADLSLEQVAVRARPVNQREKKLECDICVSWLESLESPFSTKVFAEFA